MKMQKVVWSMQKPDLQHHLSTRVKYVKRLHSSLVHLTGLSKMFIRSENFPTILTPVSINILDLL